MVRFLLLIAISSGLIAQSTAQDTTIKYFNKKWKLRKAEWLATYTKKEIRHGANNYEIKYIHKNKGLLYEGEYQSLNPEIEHGVCKHYDKEGGLLEKGYFKNGHPDSLWIVFNKESKTYDTINYGNVRKQLKENVWKAPEYRYYEMVNVRKLAEYNYYEIVENPPSFPALKKQESQYRDFKDYLSSETYYPLMARKKNIEGGVRVQFGVGKDGNIYDVSIFSGQSKYLDLEAARVIMNSPQWNPGKQSGKKVAVRVRKTVNFYKD